MAPDPADRFQTVQAMAAALSRSAVGADSVPPSEFLLPAPQGPAGPEANLPRGFLRHEGRLLGWVLALVAVAAVLVAVGLTLAKDDLSGLFGEDPPPGTRGSQTTTAATTPIQGIEGASYDPLGNPQSENDEDAENAVDGDPDTVWQTDRYNSAALGGLKPGVGFVLSLDSPREARQLKLNLTAAGSDFTVYATADEAVPDTIDGGGWQEVITRTDAAEQLTVRLSGGPKRHYLVWFTDLPQDGGGYRIGIAEAVLRS